MSYIDRPISFSVPLRYLVVSLSNCLMHGEVMHALIGLKYRRGLRSKLQSIETPTSGCFPQFKSRLASTASSPAFSLAARFLRRSRTANPNLVAPSVTSHPSSLLCGRPVLYPKRKRLGRVAATCFDGAYDANELDTGYLEVANQYNIMQPHTSEEGPSGARLLRQVSDRSHSTFTRTLDTPLPALNEATLDNMALLTVGESEPSERAPQIPQLGNESLFYAGYNWRMISARGSSMDSDAWKRWGMVFDVDGVDI